MAPSNQSSHRDILIQTQGAGIDEGYLGLVVRKGGASLVSDPVPEIGFVLPNFKFFPNQLDVCLPQFLVQTCIRLIPLLTELPLVAHEPFVNLRFYLVIVGDLWTKHPELIAYQWRTACSRGHVDDSSCPRLGIGLDDPASFNRLCLPVV